MTFPMPLTTLCWFWSKSPEWWVAFGTILLAVMTFVLALVTVFFDLVKVLLAKTQLEGGVETTMSREESVAKRSRCLLVQGPKKNGAGGDLQKFGDCVLTPADAPKLWKSAEACR